MIYPGKKGKRSNHPRQATAYPLPCLLAMPSMAGDFAHLREEDFSSPVNAGIERNTIQTASMGG
jgi:hypothetical protein